MYPKKQPKSDREKFYGAFQKKVGCKPEQYLRRKLAGGMQEAELRRLYDMLAVEIAMKARCTAIRYDALQLEPAGETAAERHIRRAATHEVPICARCGGRMVLRIEDLDAQRSKREYVDAVQRDFERLGLTWDEGPFFQHDREEAYRAAFDALAARGLVYPCFCTRADLHEHLVVGDGGHGDGERLQLVLMVARDSHRLHVRRHVAPCLCAVSLSFAG